MNNRDKPKNGRELSYDDAYEEVVADSCESFLSDSNIVSKIAELKTTDKTLWGQIKTFLKKWLDKVRALYKGFEPDSYEGQLVKQMADKLDHLHSLWAEALVDASEAATRGTTTPKQNEVTSQNNAIKYIPQTPNSVKRSDEKFSDRTESLSPRAVLANVLESSATTARTYFS
ncbi:MAG: hypothetical protein IKA82_02685 [Clostridia bacterium]|nr:hypothetical protein [Clostridia bacterium]